MPPELNLKRAAFVLGKIDEILCWEKLRGQERDLRFVDLGRYLCEVRAGQYWRLEKMKSFDEFLERREGERFESATWLHKAQELPKEEFRREVERHLTGRETEAWELLYFKLYKSQLAVIEQALETAALMLGSDKSRGYCLEMICADFLAGANLQGGNPEALLLAVCQLLEMLLPEQRQQILRQARVTP